MTDNVIERLERLEKLVDDLQKKLISTPHLPFIPLRAEPLTCSHFGAVPSHMVITRPTTFTCPDCGELVTVNPNVIY